MMDWTDWTDPEDADPVADIRANVKRIYEMYGYKPQKYIMSQDQMEACERVHHWITQTKIILDSLPRWRWMTRLVLERQMYGHLHLRLLSRSYRLKRLLWKIQDFIQDRG